MREAEFTSKLLRRLRAHPALGGVRERVVKHNNTYVRGIADFSVTFGARTTWWEVKRYGEKPTKIQQWYLDKVYGTDGGAVIMMSEDCQHALVSGCEWAGYMTIDEVVLEIVARSVGR